MIAMERKIKLKSLNPHISCKICKGYLIDATTVTECLHTFCKSCLIKHLEEHNTCPSCKIVIHQSHPLNYISYDRTMQDIVYKLAPNLQQNELRREKEFYKKRGLPYPKANTVQQQQNSHDKEIGKSFSHNINHNNSIISNNNSIISNISSNNFISNCLSVGAIGDNNSNHFISRDERNDCHRSDEQVNIVLESLPGSNLKSVKKKYIRCSSHTTVTHIKKLIAKKLFNSDDRYKEIDILCDDQLLGKDHTLKFIYVTHWRFKDPPLRLHYRPRLEF